MTIISLCDFSGEWSRPYLALEHTVIRVDPKHGTLELQGGIATGFTEVSLIDLADGAIGIPLVVEQFARLLEKDPTLFGPVDGVLAAPPCTDFAGSGAQWWKDKDAAGTTQRSIAIIEACLKVVELVKPRFWALENPVGRLEVLVPSVGKKRMTFDPCDYAGWADDPVSEAYTKRTCLWGSFNAKLRQNKIEPIFFERSGKRYSPIAAMTGGKSERTKEIRSKTPQGFSRAFAVANP